MLQVKKGVHQRDRSPQKTSVEMKVRNVAGLDLIVVPPDTLIYADIECLSGSQDGGKELSDIA